MDLIKRTMIPDDCVAFESAKRSSPSLRVIQHVEAAEVAELRVAGHVTPHAGPIPILSLAHFLVANPDRRCWMLLGVRGSGFWGV